MLIIFVGAGVALFLAICIGVICLCKMRKSDRTPIGVQPIEQNSMTEMSGLGATSNPVLADTSNMSRTPSASQVGTYDDTPTEGKQQGKNANILG